MKVNSEEHPSLCFPCNSSDIPLQLTAKLVEGDNPLDFLDNSMIPRIYKGSKKEPCSLPEKDGKFLIEDLAQVGAL